MSELIVPPGFGLMLYRLADGSTEKINTVSMGIDLNLAADTALEICEALAIDFRLRWTSHIDSGFTFLGARLIIGSDGPYGVAEYAESVAATRATTSAAAGANGVVVSKQTALIGRQHRGRIFLPGTVATGEVTEAGRITTARVAALQATAITWLGNFTNTAATGLTNGQPPMLLHAAPESGGALPAPDLVTWLTVRNVYAIVRRRRPRVT